jgi:hypothetical protein
MNFVEDAAERFWSGQRTARIELVVTAFVEPGAGYVEQLQAGNEARQRERVNGKLGDGFVGARVRLVVEDVDGAVADLQKIDMSCDEARVVAVARNGQLLGSAATPPCRATGDSRTLRVR